MDIKKIEVGKEYYLSNNGDIQSFICESNDGIIIVIKLIQYIGCSNKRIFFTSNLNSIECERYVISKNKNSESSFRQKVDRSWNITVLGYTSVVVKKYLNFQLKTDFTDTKPSIN